MSYSQLAAEDLQDVRDEGLAPTDEDIIRLHTLASRITSGEETTAATAPRFALAGGYVFHEPTMAAREWFGFAKRFVADNEVENWLFAYACVHGRERGHFDALQSSETIEKALGEFIGHFSGTRDEMLRAATCVALGDEVEAEKTEMQKKHDEEESKRYVDREKRNFAALEDVLARAAAATGLTFDDLMVQTPSRLRAMIFAAHVQAGMPMSKTSGKAHADYLATLAAIRKRLETEKEARDAAGKGV